MNNSIKDFGCVLHAKWVSDIHTPNTIIGKWAEDDSTYQIVVPEQLRDEIIDLQNALSVYYNTIQDVNLTLKQMLNVVDSIFNFKDKDTQ